MSAGFHQIHDDDWLRSGGGRAEEMAMNMKWAGRVMAGGGAICCLVGSGLWGQPISAIEFNDSTGTNPTGRVGWQGDAATGHFFVETPGGVQAVTVRATDLSVTGTVAAARFAGDGSGLTGIVTHAVLDEKADSMHTHRLGDIAGLADSLAARDASSVLAAKADTGHSHGIGSITGLAQSLSGKASVTSVQAKADTAHRHGFADLEWGDGVGISHDAATGNVGIGGDSEATSRLVVSAGNTVGDPAEGGAVRAVNHGGAGPGVYNVGISAEASSRAQANVAGYLSAGGAGSAYNYAAYGSALGGTSQNYGGYFESGGGSASANYGGFGYAKEGGSNRGIYGRADGGVTAYGVYGYARDGTDASYGVYGKAEPGSTSPAQWAGYFEGNLHATGNVTWDSDQRYKRNVESIDHALETVQRLRGVTFRWRRDEFPRKAWEDRGQLGLVAQEVETVVPEIVHTDGEGYKAVAYAQLAPLLIEAIKQQQALIERQGVALDLLQSRISELEAGIPRASEPGVPESEPGR